MNPFLRYRRLDSLLAGLAGLWRPLPFRELRPRWCGELPALAEHLLSLEEAAVDVLIGDNGALIREIIPFVPEMAEFPKLIALPALVAPSLPALGSRLSWEIPGRKAEQIRAFASAMGLVTRPVVEWCGGKGHLGRLLGASWDVAVSTLELDEGLCRAGEGLARRAGVKQGFRTANVLSAEALHGLEGCHAVALHACGDLHLALVRDARAAGLAALDLAPCCYHRTVQERAPSLAGGRFLPQREDLRLAVRDTVTASNREVRLRRKEMAWKSAFVHWRTIATGEAYRSFRPVPDAWLKGSFGEFCRLLGEREGVAMPPEAEFSALEELGRNRAREAERLTLLRLAFRRPLETWLALDRALCLAAQGYDIRIGEFCARPLTPRNILVSAR
ncbi:MAG: methyltransferase [Rhodocyclaceae bacterium]|nr:methyltransferase [Rhodocyclaceae bacterium]